MKRLLLAIALLLGALTPALAVMPDEILDNPVLEQRARDISRELRCLVCQNQSIDDSDAQLARDLRILVRERLVEGDSDDEVFDFVVARYGEFVLLRPVFEGHTIVLWIAAPLLLLAGLGAVVFAARRRGDQRVAGGPEATEEERAALDRLTRD